MKTLMSRREALLRLAADLRAARRDGTVKGFAAVILLVVGEEARDILLDLLDAPEEAVDEAIRQLLEEQDR